MLTLFPTPAQESDFLQLHYVNQCGYPEGAHTSLYLHPWAVHDNLGLAGEMEILRDPTDDGFRVILRVYSWAVAPYGDGSPHCFDRGECDAQWWESGETFGQFFDAEAFALFTWERWRKTGRPGASGLSLAENLDNMFNHVA
jgi:hypothetical protein|tara:strand:+ start:306 stop:731 length:426 start_codon:yes stop_codon:yes gene_type:complete